MPTIVDLMPSGRFLMEDFCYAGGLPVVLRQLDEAGLLNAGALTTTGRTMGENVATAVNWNTEVIRPMTEPLQPAGTGTAILRGNLAPDGAVIKQSAATPALMTHVGRALVFDSPEAYHAVCDDDGPRRHRRRHPDHPGRRAEGLPGHARGGQRAAARQAAARRGDRHGADQRRPDERHRLRHGRPARLPGGGRRRPARAGADR